MGYTQHHRIRSPFPIILPPIISSPPYHYHYTTPGTLSTSPDSSHLSSVCKFMPNNCLIVGSDDSSWWVGVAGVGMCGYCDDPMHVINTPCANPASSPMLLHPPYHSQTLSQGPHNLGITLFGILLLVHPLLLLAKLRVLFTQQGKKWIGCDWHG